MKYKVCSMLPAAALAFPCGRVSARADALETGGDFPEATGEPASSDGELSDETGSQEESAVKGRRFDAEKTATLSRGLSEKKRLPQWKNRWIFSEEIVVTGTAERKRPTARMHPGQARTAGTKRLWYSVFLIWIRTKKEPAFSGCRCAGYYAPEHSELAERQSELGFE